MQPWPPAAFASRSARRPHDLPGWSETSHAAHGSRAYLLDVAVRWWLVTFFRAPLLRIMRRINSSTAGFCSCVAGVCAKAGLASTQIPQGYTEYGTTAFSPSESTCIRNILAFDCYDCKTIQSIDRKIRLECVFAVSTRRSVFAGLRPT